MLCLLIFKAAAADANPTGINARKLKAVRK
jgi:hypothetical protein